MKEKFFDNVVVPSYLEVILQMLNFYTEIFAMQRKSVILLTGQLTINASIQTLNALCGQFR